jgi:hypothetical protein
MKDASFDDAPEFSVGLADDVESYFPIPEEPPHVTAFKKEFEKIQKEIPALKYIFAPEYEPEPEPKRKFDPLNLNSWRTHKKSIPIKLYVICEFEKMKITYLYYIYIPHLNEMFFSFYTHKYNDGIIRSDNSYFGFYCSTFLDNGQITYEYKVPGSEMVGMHTVRIVNVIPRMVKKENVQSIINMFCFALCRIDFFIA